LLIQSYLMKKIIVCSLILVFSQVTLSIAQTENDDQLIESILGTLDKSTPSSTDIPSSKFEITADSLEFEKDKTRDKDISIVEEKKMTSINEQKEKVRLKEKEQRYRELTQKRERLDKEKTNKVAKKERLKSTKKSESSKSRTKSQTKTTS